MAFIGNYPLFQELLKFIFNVDQKETIQIKKFQIKKKYRCLFLAKAVYLRLPGYLKIISILLQIFIN